MTLGSWRDRLLGVLSDPSLALLLMMVGIYGLVFEFMNPGFVAPGVIGGVSLLLALWGLQMLPINYTGLALILLGIAFFVAEAFVPSYGALGLAFTLALKATVLGLLLRHSPALAAAALVWAHAVSRAAAVALLATLPYAGDAEHAKAKPMAQRARAADAAVALGWIAVLGIGLSLGPVAPRSLLLSALCAAGVAAWCARWFLRRLGGYTGDTLGATQQWAELAMYLALAAAHG